MAGTLNANQIIPDQGQTLYINGIDYAANVVIGNAATSIATFSPSGNLTVQGSITANTITSASGNVSVTGAVSATGNVSGSNIVSSGTVSGSSVSSTGNVSANNITSSYDITASSFNGGPLGGMRNRIINGAMMIDQRNAGASVTVNNNTNNYTLDRWNTYGQPTDGVFTVQRVTDAPTGFVNSLKVTVTTADASIGAAQSYALRYSIEGYNVSDLGFGTANAVTTTLSFWVKSSVTGTYSVGYINDGYSRAYPATYTINTANTWEFKSVTIVGDTTGTWTTDNSTGLRLWWSLGAGTKTTAGVWNAGTSYTATGSVDLISTNGATFYITGVQLEPGATATPFENRLYGTELALCQRYYQIFTSSGVNYSAYGNGCWFSGTYGEFQKQFLVPMRSAPTATVSAGNTFLANGVAALTPNASPGPGYMTNLSARINVTVASGATGGYSFMLIDAGAGSSSMQFNAEL